jgi:hypothetical protein
MLRRDFLQLGALPLLKQQRGVNCILLRLVGGPSHLDTWDMKPDAPSEIRGPFRPIRTNVPGIEISEIFPRMAKHADKYALIRSVYSDAPPAHQCGTGAATEQMHEMVAEAKAEHAAKAESAPEFSRTTAT